jgi:GT2 family glycosyltransferase
MTVRYRNRMNFTFNSLKAAEKALTTLRHRIWLWKNLPPLESLPPEAEEWRRRFWSAVEKDLDLPSALAITWEMVRSDLPGQAKLALVLDFDRVFGLSLERVPERYQLPESVITTVAHRSSLRQRAEYATTDTLREELSSQGYLVEDTQSHTRIRPKTPLEQQREKWHAVSSSREVENFLRRPSLYDFTFILNAYEYVGDIQRGVQSMLKYSEGYSAEIIVIDNGSTDGTADWLEEFQAQHSNVRVIHCDHVVGDAAGKNIGLKQSLGKIIIIMDGSVEIVGDILGPIAQQLADETVGVFGPYGLTTDDMRHFHEEVSQGDADAIQAYCMAFRREAVNRVGLMRECFRFYRNLDIDYCFQFKNQGYRIVADNTLPLVRHEHRQWTELDENVRDELSRKNFGRFLRLWGNRPDLLITAGAAGMGNTFFHH